MSEADLSPFVGRFLSELTRYDQRLDFTDDGFFHNRVGLGSGIGKWQFQNGELCFNPTGGTVMDDIAGCYRVAANAMKSLLRMIDQQGAERFFSVE